MGVLVARQFRCYCSGNESLRPLADSQVQNHSGGVSCPETEKMNCAPLRSAVFPANSPKWDIVVASVFLIATTAGLISAKTMAFSGAIFIALLTITYAVRGNLSIALFKQSSATLPVTGFLLLTAASFLGTGPNGGPPVDHVRDVPGLFRFARHPDAGGRHAF